MESKIITAKENLKNVSLSRNDMTGKVVGISEEKDKSTISILLDNYNMAFDANKKEFKLGELLELNVEIRAVKKKYA